MGSALTSWRLTRPTAWTLLPGAALLFLILMAMLPSAASAYLPTADGRWLWQNPQPQGNRLADVCFVDETHGWAVGEGGTILVSKDGGQTWKSQTSGTSRDLNVVCFLDETHGWAAGEWEYVLVTRDGGATWSRQHRAVQQEGINYIGNLRSMSFPDAGHGWIVGTENTLMHTTDGGRHWQTTHFDVSSGPFPRLLWRASLVDFVDAEHGWIAVSGHVCATTDGGASWEELESIHSTIIAMDFIDRLNGWVTTSSEVFATHDGGRTWSRQWRSGEHSSLSGVVLRDISFLDQQRGWAVGAVSGGRLVLRTTDGGQNWRTDELVGHAELATVQFTDSEHGWGIERAGASYAGVSATTDGGRSWDSSTAATYRTLTAVEALGAKQAVAVGEHGAIVATTDGSVWHARQSPTAFDLAGLSFPDADHGWAVGDGGTIIASSDGGASWQPQSSPIGLDLYDVSFADATHGWAVGPQGTIIHTSDGVTWGAQESGLPQDMVLTSVSFLDRQRGWAAGVAAADLRSTYCVSCYILTTEDGGENWRPIVNGRWLGRFDSLEFVSATEGWAAASGHRRSVLHTTDGGRTWESVGVATDGYANAVRFLDDRHGWVVSSEGRIATTHNGGTTWTVENTGFARNLLDVDFFDEGHGWAVGEGGAIIAYPDPVPLAPQSSKVRRGNIATLRYKVGASRSARVDVKIRIRNKRGKVVRILTQRNRRPNSIQTVRFRCRLPRGGYRFYVSAVDSAGRHQLRQGANKLTVMRR